MKSFEFHAATRIVFGPGSLDRLGSLVRELGGTRVLLVTDPGICSVGHAARAADCLVSAGVRVHIFDGVAENPTTDHVEHGRREADAFRPDVIVGLGGGSAMDCAKGINFIYTNGGSMNDFWGEDKARRDLLPAVGVPTTAGTGSETQSYALITDPTSRRKMACGDKKAAFRVALLDPLLTHTQPHRVTALTGIDAVAHAVETYVTKRRNPVSLAFSREAWRLLSASFPRVLDEPDDPQARSEMQIGAAFAGLAIENSMLGAAHALANPLTSQCGIVHGEAIGIMLPHVVRFNGQPFEAWYRELLECTGAEVAETCADNAAGKLACVLRGWIRQAGLACRLADYDIHRDRLRNLAEDAARQWTAGFNPRDVGPSELLTIYEQAL